MVKMTAPQWATFAKKSEPKKNAKNAKNEKKKKPSKKVVWANEKGGELANVRYVSPVGKMTKTGAAQSTTKGGMSLTIKERLALDNLRKRSALYSARQGIAQTNHNAAVAKKKLASDVRNLSIARSMKLGGADIKKFENAAKKSENRLLNAEIAKNIAKMKSRSTRSQLL
jgi:hypothetical protein